MKVKIIFLFTLMNSILVINNVNAQSRLLPTINLGASYRFDLIEPYKGGSSFINGRYMEEGAIFCLDIKQKVFRNNNLTLQLSNYFNYSKDRIYRGFNPQSLIRDHFVDLLYPISFKNKNYKISFGIGYGIMNANTKFIGFEHEILSYNPYTFIKRKVPINKRFLAPRIGIGGQYKSLSVFVNAHFTPIDAEGIKAKSVWIELKTTYQLNLKKCKK